MTRFLYGTATAPGRAFMSAAVVPRPAMRRLVLVAPRSDLERFEGLPELKLVESFRVVHQFRFNPHKVAGICEVKFQIPALTPERMVGHAGLEKVEPLAMQEDGAYLAYFEGRPTVGWARLATSTGAHLLPPFELTPKNWRITVLGTGPQLRRFLVALRKLRIHYRVQTIGSADWGTKSQLGTLTTRQREVLITAYRLGYYDVPRQGDSARVAKVLNLGKSTAVEHLRKAEKRLLDQIMSEYGPAARITRSTPYGTP
jgi:hypothetical protein